MGKIMNEKNDPTRLGRERIGKLLFEFALPAVFGMLFNTLYNVIDTAFLQYALGDTGAAVATLAMPIMQILMGISMLAGMGGCALASIQMGEGKHDKVELTLGNTVLLLVLMGALVALVGHLAMPLLLAIAHSVFGMQTAMFILTVFGRGGLLGSILLAAAIILVIYGFYFAITYICSRKIISE